MSTGWALNADAIEYVPKGVGSYHWVVDAGPKYFVTVDDLDTKPWIGSERDPTFEGLGAAYDATWVLHHEAGLGFVVAPLRRPDGSTVVRLCDRYSMAVFPFVEGRAGRWGEPVADPVRTALLRVLARLHQTTGHLGDRIGRRPLDVPERSSLAKALHELDQPWTGGPLSEPARHALADHAVDVTGWLSDLDDLAHRLTDEDEDEDEADVPTHGEPHPGNLMHGADGLHLVDWDTLALARRERDLWMLDGGSGGLALYEHLTGRTINSAAVSFYRLAWTLSDIASFAAMFRSPHEETRWMRQKWSGFERLLGGAPSAPFGESPAPH